jgi:hypothetical protein
MITPLESQENEPMRTRTLLACTLVATLTMAAPAFGQDYTPPRTPDGRPDISGIWTSFDSTPFETPGPEVWEDLKALAAWFPGIDGSGISGPGVGPSSDFSPGEVDAKRNEPRRSMVVDPPSGVVPILPAAQAVRDENLRLLPDHWVHNTPWERCITRGVPGMMFPTYNTGHLILQTPGYVTISSEMIHLTRPIPLDDRPALSSKLRQWDGVPRGRWEGDTLVVEVTHYNTQGTVGTNAGTRRIRGVPQSEAMRVTERFIPVDENTILYRVTVDDPNAFGQPWTVELPMNRSPDYRIYEYSCHEGNYGLENTLRGGRADDAAGR